MKLLNPWPEGYKINANSPYGWRIHPISKTRKFHQGVDVAGSFPVHAPADGVIAHVGWSASGGGHTVIIKHATDLYTVYYHGAHKTEWEPGQEIKRGDFIYQSGTTGASTGDHLHFEVRKSRKWGDTMNPEQFLVDTIEEPQEPVSAPPVPEPKQAKVKQKSVPARPSVLNRVSPGLAAWHRSWMKRGQRK